MDIKNILGHEYSCNICNKNYANYNSLWKHNKRFHKNTINILKSSNNIPINKPDIPISSNNYNCKYCNKSYDKVKTRWAHEQKCKILFEEDKQQKSEMELNIINNKKEILDKQNELIKNEIELAKLKLKIQASKKIDTKTFKSLNKALKERAFLKMQNSNINSHNTNNIQNNNIVNNNIQLIGFSKEEVINTITNKEKSQIMANGYQCLEKFIEITNTGKYDQFKNIIITNIKDPYAYKFDDKQGFFVTCNKTEVLNELINNRVTDIEAIYNEFDEANKINDKTKKIICTFLDQINDTQKPYIEQNENRTYENYFDFKVHKIKILLFDNQDKITKDIALFIEDK